MGRLAPKDIVRYHKGSDPPRFAILEDSAKEDPWGDTWKIRIWGQDKSLEAVKDLLTPTYSPSQIPTNPKEMEKEGGHGQDMVN